MDAHTFLPGTSERVFLFADHASRHIPAEYADLGLSGDDLTRHIAWDIGTEALTRRLAARFDAPALIAGVSRLVIDLNRDPSHPGLVPTESDGTIIDANANLCADRMNGRLALYARYHERLSAELDARPEAFAVSLHSFTPHPRSGTPRSTDIGLLAKRTEDGGDWESAEAFLAALPANLETGINVPYSAYDLNHTVDAHVIPRRLRHLAIEVRQDHLGNAKGIDKFAGIIGDALETLL